MARLFISSLILNIGIIQLFGYFIATWFAMPRSLVKLTEILYRNQLLAWLDSDQKAAFLSIKWRWFSVAQLCRNAKRRILLKLAIRQFRTF